MEAQKLQIETIKALAIIGGQWYHIHHIYASRWSYEDPTKLDFNYDAKLFFKQQLVFEKSICGVNFENYLAFNSVDDIEKIEWFKIF